MSLPPPLNESINFQQFSSTYMTPDRETSVVVGDTSIIFSTNLSTTPLVASIGIDGITTNNPTGFNLLSPVNFNLNGISNVKGISVDGDYGTVGQVLTADGAEGMSWDTPYILPSITANYALYSNGTDVSGSADFQHKSNTGILSINEDLSFTSAYPIGIECAFSDATFTTALSAQNKSPLDGASVSVLLSNDLASDSAYYGGLTMFSSNSLPLYGFPSMKNALSLNSQSSNIVISPWNGQQDGTAEEDANIMLTYNGGQKAHIINNNGQLIVGATNPSYSGATYGGDDGGTDKVLMSNGVSGLKWDTPSTPSLQQVLDVSNNTTTGIYMNGAGIYYSDSHILPSEFKIHSIGDVGDSASMTITANGTIIINDDGAGILSSTYADAGSIRQRMDSGGNTDMTVMDSIRFYVNDGITAGSILTKTELTTPNLKATTITDMNDSIGLDGQYLVSTGAGLEWSNQLVSNTPIIVPASIGTYTDSQPPSFNVVDFNTVPYDGWYFQNYRTGGLPTPYSNIGWNMYLSNGTYPSSISYNSNHMKQMYVCFMSMVSTCSIGLNVYTSPATGGNFYKSRFGTILQGATVDISLNKQYIAYYDFSGNTYPAPTKFLHTPLQMMVSPVNVGSFYNETLNYFSVCSNTIASANADSFIVSEAGFIMEDGTQQPFRQPYLFQSASIQPLNPFSLQQALLTSSVILTTANIGYTFIVSSGTTLNMTNTTGLSSNFIQNGVFSVYNARTAGNNIVITYSTVAPTTYTLLAGKSVSFVWVGGTTNLLRLQ